MNTFNYYISTVTGSELSPLGLKYGTAAEAQEDLEYIEHIYPDKDWKIVKLEAL